MTRVWNQSCLSAETVTNGGSELSERGGGTGRTLGLVVGRAGYKFLAATKEAWWFWVPLGFCCNTREEEKMVQSNCSCHVRFLPQFVLGYREAMRVNQT